MVIQSSELRSGASSLGSTVSPALERSPWAQTVGRPRVKVSDFGLRVTSLYRIVGAYRRLAVLVGLSLYMCPNNGPVVPSIPGRTFTRWVPHCTTCSLASRRSLRKRVKSWAVATVTNLHAA